MLQDWIDAERLFWCDFDDLNFNKIVKNREKNHQRFRKREAEKNIRELWKNCLYHIKDHNIKRAKSCVQGIEFEINFLIEYAPEMLEDLIIEMQGNVRAELYELYPDEDKLLSFVQNHCKERNFFIGNGRYTRKR